MSESKPPQLNHSFKSYQRWRLIKDNITGKSVIFGGLGVLLAIVLIFFYLLYVVLPLFQPASANPLSEHQIPAEKQGKTLLLATEEQNEIAVRFTDQGKVIFFATKTGKIIKQETLPIPENVTLVSFAEGNPIHGVVIYGLSDGRAIIAKHSYKVSYPNDVRHITPSIEYPLGQQPIVVDRQGKALLKVAVRLDDDMTTIIAKTADNRIVMTHLAKAETLFDEESSLEQSYTELNSITLNFDYLLIDKEQRQLYLADKVGNLSVYNITDKENPKLITQLNVLEKDAKISCIKFLNGEISLLIGDSLGHVSQWSLVRDRNNQYKMIKLRSFNASNYAITAISAEQRRKGFAVADAKGSVGIYYSTSERQLINTKVSDSSAVALALSPKANTFLLQNANHIHFWHVHNEHPEISLKSLWQKVWYESYSEPAYIWQSSSSSNDFEPKLSLTPLLFGTLKAAFYAMIVAIPLAIMGAIYTAYFMAPTMRSYVKPSIELMEALPTVILGFLAGLWLAPFVEKHLLAIFSLFMTIPFGVIIFAFFWHHLPSSIRHKVPNGWDAALLIPVIIFSGWFAFAISPSIEALCFNGDLKFWMKNNFDIGYDQRNSLVVGLAMGFAVIPTIFSITEDAIFSVPKNLTIGSLALGATPWQTLSRVVLLTASPGIFSAVMIGLGRAVGETMIVLMATGNTPVMDLSIFQGMRTLSANIAVEMPESEVNSTHYRVLFLAALVLFMFTFAFNTIAEIIRQNLREKYSSL